MDEPDNFLHGGHESLTECKLTVLSAHRGPVIMAIELGHFDAEQIETPSGLILLFEALMGEYDKIVHDQLSTLHLSNNHIFLHKEQIDMKSQEFPVFIKEIQSGPKQIDADLFISYLSTVDDVKIVRDNLKRIEDNINILAKQPDSSQQVIRLIQQLCLMFKKTPAVELLSLVRTAINPDVKFEASKKDNDDVMQSENIRNVVSDQPIALPYYESQDPAYGPPNNPSPNVATHSPNAVGDVSDQQRQSDSKSYLAADNEVVESYLQKRFKTVKREGISQFFTRVAEIISSELMEEYLQQNFLDLPINIIVEMLKLLQYICAPLYSFHLIDIAQAITNKLHILLERKETEKLLSKDQYSSVTGTFNNIVERLSEYPAYNGESWNFQTDVRMIKLFIQSEVSQKKLFCIKSLGEICRRSTYYNYTIPSEKIKIFIESNHVLEEIYRADNHPEVIAKGEEVLLYMSKNQCLSRGLIDLVFDLLQKCHENLSKSLFSTLQRIQQKNIENHRNYLLQKIIELPRSNCFNEETFSLIQKIILLTPPEEISYGLQKVFAIIDNNFDNLRDSLRQESIKLLLDIYVMGIELEVFNERNVTEPLQVVFAKPESNLFAYVVEAFVLKIKDKTYHQKYGGTCRKMLQQTINILFQRERIHKVAFAESIRKVRILMLLLEYSQQIDDETLDHEQLWSLIKVNNQFSKFIRHYPKTIQTKMISQLIRTENKTSHDLKCIIDLYHIINPRVKKSLEPIIVDQYHKTIDSPCKVILAPQIIRFKLISLQQVFSHINPSEEGTNVLISWLILFRQILKKQDEKGYGDYPPFHCLQSSYDVFVKVDKYNIMYQSSEFELTVKSYNTLYEISSKILKIFEQPFSKTKIKLNNTILELPDMKKRISQMTHYSKVAIEIYETEECEWFDKAQLFDKDSYLKPEITDCLKEIFEKFSSVAKGKLFADNIVEVFKIATKQDGITIHDPRISEIINIHSHSGDFLTIEEWIAFFTQSSLNNAPVVVTNLVNLGYKQLFSSSESFEDMFSNDQTLRKGLVKDDSVYQVLFNIYDQMSRRNICDLDKSKVTDQLIGTLNLLPTCQPMMAELKEQNESVFNRQTQSHLYSWYLSQIAKYVYFDASSVEQHGKWREMFRESSNISAIKNIYIGFLQVLLSQDGSDFNKSQLAVKVMQNFGGIAREALKKVPNLVTTNVDEISPLTYEDVEPFVEKTCINDFSQIMKKLSSFSVRVFSTNQSIYIVENAMAVVAHLILKQSKISSVRELELRRQMIFHENKQMRTLFNSFYLLIANVIPSIKESYYSVYINKNDQENTCKEYFNVFSKLLSFQEDDKRYSELSQVLQKDISSYNFDGEGQKYAETDERLLGELKVINYIKLYNPKTIIEKSTINSIQSMLEQNSSEQIRQILYDMSYSFCDFESNFKMVMKIMENLNLSKNSSMRGPEKMGMFNLGCTCYINSVIQQLQMIEPFRAGIISTKVEDNSIDFFRQFQAMIYQLTFGKRIYLIPQNFCLNYLDYNGQPVNIKQQHDADEFLNQLFDRLETRLQPTNQGSLIGKNFKGQVVNIINCDRCFSKKERVENFYILSVEIKNLKSLEECINKYIEPEAICDFFCETCDKKETIQKYYRFKTLPPFLFIHLQRLVFDLQSMYKIKLDHPINFPHQLDLSRYFNVESSEPQLYNLKGFVVHVGSSEGGHYYSIIKCDGQWVKFDDTRIDPWKWDDGNHDKNNAYMLIYEKQADSKDIVKRDVSIGNLFLMDQIKNDNFHLQKQKIFLQHSFSKFLLQVYSSIKIPEEFSTSPEQLFSNPYHENCLQVPENVQKQLDLAYQVYFRYLKLECQRRQLNLTDSNYNQMNDNNNVPKQQMSDVQKIALCLMSILHYRPQFAFVMAKQYLSDQPGNFFHLLCIHRDFQVRQILKALLSKVMIIIKTEIFTNFMLPVPQNEIIQKILQRIIASLCQVGKNPNKTLDFFQLINIIVRCDKRFAEWFKCNKLGPRLIHFLMQSDSQLQGVLPDYPFYNQGGKKNPTIHIIVEILSEIIKQEKDINSNVEDFQLQRKAYLNFEFFRRLFRDRYDNNGIPRMIQFCARNNADFTRQAINFIMESINRFSHTDSYIFTFINTLYGLLSIDDDLQMERIERVLGVPLPLKKYDKQGEQYTLKTNNDRFCRYENSTERQGDEIYLSFLELLYTNRKEQNYFVLFGIAALLQLTASSPVVSKYIESLPGPCPAYLNYTDWITEFLYDSEKSKGESFKDIPAQQKQSILKEIARLINNYENSEEDSQEHLEQRSVHNNANNKPYVVKGSLKPSQWKNLSFSFDKNIMIKDIVPDNVDKLSQAEILNGQQRILVTQSDENFDIPQLIQFRIAFNCKVKVSFSAGYPYSFTFDKGNYDFALPYFEKQSQLIVVEVLEGQVKRIINHRKEQQVKKMEVEHCGNKEVERPALDDDFPTINEAYPAGNDINAAVNDASMRPEATSNQSFECPFCQYVSSTYTPKCTNCGQQLGWC